MGKLLKIVICYCLIYCLPERPVIKETVILKLKNGKEISEGYLITIGVGVHFNSGNRDLVKILREIKKGNKKNINACPANNYIASPLYLSILSGWKVKDYEEDPGTTIGKVNVTRYLLEQGANPNQTEVYAPNYIHKKTESKKIFNLKTNMAKFQSPLCCAAFGVYDFKDKMYKDKYKYSILQTSLLLSYGAKINKLGYDYQKPTDYWYKESLGKKYIIDICKQLLKEEDITKLDPDFLKYIIEHNIDKKLINRLKAKKKGII